MFKRVRPPEGRRLPDPVVLLFGFASVVVGATLVLLALGVRSAAADVLPFAPTLSVQASTQLTDVPTGLDLSFEFPQSDDPDTPLLRKAVLTLPEGMTINLSSTDGLGVCTDGQLGLGTTDPSSCPDSARIGAASVSTLALPDPMTGSIYLRPQASTDPESGALFRLVVVLDENGSFVKLPGSVRADAATGRIVVTLDDIPQLAASQIDLQLTSGDRALLATSPDCGAKAVTAQLTSWDGQVADLSDSLSFDCPGVMGLAPVFAAGMGNAVGGAFAPFTLSLERPERQLYMNNLRVELPTGLLANINGLVGQEVGSVRLAVGVGSSPLVLPGKVFLEGAYEGAPFSLVNVVPAQAGPFDLGEVVVRQPLFVDPVDAHVTSVSDPFVTILRGVPVRLRSLHVDLDRPGFTLNPTSCVEKQILATVGATNGSSVPIAVAFQVAGCESLPFAPTMAISLTGKHATTDGTHPGVRAGVTAADRREANAKKVVAKLPLSLALDPNNAQALCEFEVGQAVHGGAVGCPKGSIVGSATAITPLLNRPLTGPVYFVKGVRIDPKSGRQIKTLPTLLVPLRGEIALDLRATSSVVGNHLVTTFDDIPDAFVQSFTLTIDGGRHGILVVSNADVCKSNQIFHTHIDAQNGKAEALAVTMRTPCPLRVLSKTVSRRAVKVKVGGLGAGRLTISGRGVRRTVRRLGFTTVATIGAPLTKAGRRHRPTKVTVTFRAAGVKRGKRLSVSVRSPARARHHRIPHR